MLPKVSFYNFDSVETDDILAHSLDLTYQFFKQQKRVYINASSQNEAEHLDEQLWVRDPDSFVPHRLNNESQDIFAPVIIGFEQVPSQAADVLVNLALTEASIPSYFKRFNTIIEFVANDEERKEKARAKFRQYRQSGCQLHHEKYQ